MLTESGSNRDGPLHGRNTATADSYRITPAVRMAVILFGTHSIPQPVRQLIGRPFVVVRAVRRGGADHLDG